VQTSACPPRCLSGYLEGTARDVVVSPFDDEDVVATLLDDVTYLQGK